MIGVPVFAGDIRMTSKTSYLIGLIGSGIAGSLTPAMHEEEGRVLGLN